MLYATYSPEDNKLRLYSTVRLDEDTYGRVKAAGFQWAPKQGLFVAPSWTPSREDLLVDLCGAVGDEDTSLVERAEAKAERLEDLSDRRRAEATAVNASVDQIAERFAGGQPILVGHHSERKAGKDAERIQSGMRKVVRLWDEAAYWQSRAKGALRLAKYKERPDVRARRIKGLESDLRRQEKNLKVARASLAFWQRDDLTLEQAKHFTNYYDRGPIRLADGTEHWSAWGALDAGKATADEVRAQRREQHAAYIPTCERWVAHFEHRLSYERAMLAESGYQTPPKKPSRSALPLLNYSGEVIYRNRYGGETVTTQAVGMTKAEYAAIPGDYKGTFISACGTHRVRSAMVRQGEGFRRALCAVYITDSKQHPRPSSAPGEPTAEREITATPTRRATPARVSAPVADPMAVQVEALRGALRAGVEVVTAPQLFPTPPELAAKMVEAADLRPGLRVLEPSAGTGNLLRALFDALQDDLASITAVEIHPALAGALKAGFPHSEVRCADFLGCNGDLGTFDRILMNPPFDHGMDIRHIQHALTFLRPGGRLVALCANGPKQRDALIPLAGAWLDLEPGAFRSSGTMASVALVVIDAAASVVDR